MSSTMKGGRRHHKRSAHKKSHKKHTRRHRTRRHRGGKVDWITSEHTALRTRRKSSPQEAPQAFRSQEVSQEAFSQTERWHRLFE